MHRFITHSTTTSWGTVTYIMEEHGRAFARMYQYKEDSATIYLDSLSVGKSIRKQGVGTKLQEIREGIGKKMGAKDSFLWVLKDSWMHDWYKRRGYEDYNEYEEDANYIWMRKGLI